MTVTDDAHDDEVDVENAASRASPLDDDGSIYHTSDGASMAAAAEQLQQQRQQASSMPSSSSRKKKTNKKSSLCSQKCAATILVLCILLAIGLFASSLTASLRKPKKTDVSSTQNQIIIGSNSVAEKTNWKNYDDDDDGGISGSFMTWQQQQQQQQEPDKTESVTTTNYNNFYGEFNDDDAVDFYGEEGYDYDEYNITDELQLLPEDCDNINCSHNNNNNNNSSTSNSKASIFQGPITDFIVSNVTQIRGIDPVEQVDTYSTSKTTKCNTNQGSTQTIITTDRYGFETSFKIIRTFNSHTFASGPPAPNKFGPETTYIGSLCLPQGQYELVLYDLMGDGICCSYGNGKVSIIVNGIKVVETGNEKFIEKRYPFTVKSGGGGGGGGTSPPVTIVNSQPINNGEEVSPLTFRRGDLSVDVPELGIRISQGLSVKVLARANETIQYGNGTLSTLPFHSMADGATVLPITDDDDEGSYAYVSNSEMKQKMGGVYALYFNKYGHVVNYKVLLSGTTRNCSGGRTPWNTWLSCEEYGKGQCWQVGKQVYFVLQNVKMYYFHYLYSIVLNVALRQHIHIYNIYTDPKNERPPQVSKIGGGTGGNYESVAVDGRRKRQPIFCKYYFFLCCFLSILMYINLHSSPLQMSLKTLSLEH